MASRLERKVSDWLLDNLGALPVSVVAPVSIALAIVVGGLVPALFHVDRVLSGLYAAAGAVLGMLPFAAVSVRQRELENRRLLLLRNGYAEGIGTLTPSEFEHLIAAWYESQHFKVSVKGRSGDRGIDIFANRDDEAVAVQCKHWRSKQVGPREVRELRGSVIDPLVKPVLVTSGTFSEAARREARDKDVKLLDGADLIPLLNAVIDDVAPRCPECRGRMRPRDGRRGTFWSCLDFPRCRGHLDLAVRRSGPA